MCTKQSALLLALSAPLLAKEPAPVPAQALTTDTPSTTASGHSFMTPAHRSGSALGSLTCA